MTGLEKAENNFQLINTSLAVKSELTQLQTDYVNASSNLQIAKQTAAKYESLPSEDKIQEIEKLQTRLVELKVMDDGYIQVSKNTFAAIQIAEEAGIKAFEAAEELHEAWLATGGTCPLCEQEIINL